MVIKYYIDSSIFYGYSDNALAETTNKFINQLIFKGIRIIYSEISKLELRNAPDEVKSFVNNLPGFIFKNSPVVEEALLLTDKYIENGIIDREHKIEAIHFSLATIYRDNVLVSWDYIKMLNLKNIRGFNSVNLKLGYPIIEVRSPKELIDYEENF